MNRRKAFIPLLSHFLRHVEFALLRLGRTMWDTCLSDLVLSQETNGIIQYSSGWRHWPLTSSGSTVGGTLDSGGVGIKSGKLSSWITMDHEIWEADPLSSDVLHMLFMPPNLMPKCHCLSSQRPLLPRFSKAFSFCKQQPKVAEPLAEKLANREIAVVA